MIENDQLQKFLFERLAIRGEIVRLNASWQEVLSRHTYPTAVQSVLGQMLAASTLLSSILKFEGSLIMQIQGNGPLSLVVAECTSAKTLRGIARYEDGIAADSLINMVANGHLMVTIDPVQGERYQGIVDVSSGDIVESLENYMHRSQQLTTWLWLHANNHQCVGMLLQKMPGKPSSGFSGYDEGDSDAWSRVTQLANTVTVNEMQTLPFQMLIYRLFHEEDVRVFEPVPVSFRCTCTRDRVTGMLKMLGYEEVKSILMQQGKVGVNCEFCNHYYELDHVDIEQLFAADHPLGLSSTRH